MDPPRVSSTPRRADGRPSAAVRSPQVVELGLGGDGRVLGPGDVVLDGADRALWWADLHQLADSEHRQQAGEQAVAATDAEESGPPRDVRAGSDAERRRDGEEHQREQPDEAGAAEEAGADPGPLDLSGQL